MIVKQEKVNVMQNVTTTETDPYTSILLILNYDRRRHKTPAVLNPFTFHAPARPSRRQNVKVRIVMLLCVHIIRPVQRQPFLPTPTN